MNNGTKIPETELYIENEVEMYIDLVRKVEKLKKVIADNEIVLKSANHDVKEMVKYTKDLRKAINLAIGFCVDFRQTSDWKNHPEVGVLYIILKAAIERAEK